MRNSSTALTLRDYLRVVFRNKILFVILPIAIMIPTYIWIEMRTPQYTAHVKMFVKAEKEVKAEYYKDIMHQSVTAEHIELVNSNVVLKRVVEALKLYELPMDYEKKFASPLKAAWIESRSKKDREDFEKLSEEEKKAAMFGMAMGRLMESVSAEPIKETNLFTISVTDYDPGYVTKVANSVSRSYLIYDLEQQVAELRLKFGERHSNVIQLENYIEELQKTLDGRILPDIEAIGPATVKIVAQAQAAGRIGIFSKGVMLLLAFFGGIGLSAVFSLVLEMLDSTFKSPHEVENVLNFPVLGTLPNKKPKNKQLTFDTKSIVSTYFKSYQSLSEQIYLIVREKKLRSILITDAEGLKETPSIIGNIGNYLGNRQGHRVLIIDTDMSARSSLPKFFNVANSPGLSDVLNGTKSLDDVIYQLSINLHFLPSGSAEGGLVSLSKTPQFSDLLKKAEEQYDLVLICCASLMNHTDSVVLSSYSDGVILVINEGKTRQLVVKKAIIPLEKKKVNIIGAILDNRTYVIPKIIYKIT